MVAHRLGLTGGIASGKSSVASVLASLGAAIIDADAISRQVTAPGGAAIEPLRRRFGAEFITAPGALDRDRMRALAFSDPQARQRLEAIVHPLIATETARLTQAAMASGARCLVFDVPLLVESAHWRKNVDQVLVVDCPPELQIARAMARSGLSQQAVEQVMAAQAPRLQRLRAADLVLYNGTLSLTELAAQVRQIARCFGL